MNKLIFILCLLLAGCAMIEDLSDPSVPTEAAPVPTIANTQPAPLPTLQPDRLYCVWVESLNVREGPGLDYPVSGVLVAGDCVTILQDRILMDGSRWGMIDERAWINMEYVR